MAQIQNISPFGDLYVPTFDADVAAGETVTVDDSDAPGFLAQPDIWAPVDKVAKKVVAEFAAGVAANLKAAAARRGEPIPAEPPTTDPIEDTES